MKHKVKLRALEREDLRFVHLLDNNRNIMSYWFEEPYESFGELEDLYIRHIHDNTERRFIGTNKDNESIGLVELIEIDYIHSNAEFQIIIAPDFQGQNYAQALIHKALDYAFTILNLHKVYLLVSEDNSKAIHLYLKSGFIEEGRLVQEFFINGKYCDAIRMYQLQEQYLSAE
ncbi:spermidine N1-acetyltransferase [Psychromonas aquimarina]|uniref:spermidine N1-acetyltransferase n=1 Tax=Psychromonas aquimarina TaxID=444919 RepID=UPI0003FC1956|nr:spermidine N1-acetyltransferase [Psychromonas aquimarina]